VDIAGKYKIEDKFDLVVSNPPWITASPLNHLTLVENGVFDYK